LKNGYIYSALLGGIFFAVPYLTLNLSVLPCLAMGVTAYGAGTLIFRNKNSSLQINKNENMYEILKEAKNQIIELETMPSLLEDTNLCKNVKEIASISKKIVTTLEKKPEKLKQVNNFLNYYLPVTIKILKRYDEIENQNLKTESSDKFMKSVEEMIVKIRIAFQEQLSNMYQADMIDTDAEIKVFETMLRTDGFSDELDFEINKNKE